MKAWLIILLSVVHLATFAQVPAIGIKGRAAAASTADGQIQSAAGNNINIYISADFGDTWTAKESARDWRGIAISANGQYQTAVAYGNYVYISSDYGTTWTQKGTTDNYFDVSMSASGQYQSVAVYYGNIFISSDYGKNWSAKESNRAWRTIFINQKQ